MFHLPADNKMNILLPVESVVLSYILLLLFPFDQVMNTQAIQNNILYDERLEKRQKMSWILEKSVVATYCCSAHFGHCRILLLEAEDSDVSLETGQSSPTSARRIHPARPGSPSIPETSLNVNVQEALWPEA